MSKSLFSRTQSLIYYIRANHAVENTIAAVILTAVFFLSSFIELRIPQSTIVEGQVSDKDIIAPFSFEVKKDEAQLQAERDSKFHNLSPVYVLSESVNYQIIQNLNHLFTNLYSFKETGNKEQMKSYITNLGYEVSYTEINFLFDGNNLQRVWDYVMIKSDSLLASGLLEAPVDDTIIFENDGRTRAVETSEFLKISKAARDLSTAFNNDDIQGFIEYILFLHLEPNIVIDRNKTDELVKTQKQKLKPVLDVIQKNEIIIRKNTKISHLEYLKYQSMINSKEYMNWNNRKKVLIVRILGYGLIVFLLLSALRYMLSKLTLEVSNKSYMLLLILLVSEVLLYLLIVDISGLSSYIFPLIFFILLPAVVISTTTGLVFGAFLLIINLLTFSLDNNLQLYHALIATAALIYLDRLTVKQTYSTLSWMLLITCAIIVMAIGLVVSIPLFRTVNNLIFSEIAIVVSMAGLISLANWTESKLDTVSNNQLISMIDFNHPLLKKLATEAPGTYHHSLVVSNLAERAAEEIGSDYLLARVGSYYHDIGKLKNPSMFTENNEHSDRLHSQMGYDESAEFIKEHVSYGIQLAKQYKLPNAVMDIILTHHGTQAIKYFLKMAQENNLETPHSTFYYNGPKPQSKIAAIIMISDIVESKTKVFNEFKPQIVDETLDSLIKNKQLSDCDLSFKELGQIKEVMNVVLSSIYRKRKDYKLDE